MTIADLLEQRLEDFNANGTARDPTRNLSSANPEDIHGCVYHASLLLANHLRAATEVETSTGVYDSCSGRLPSNQPLNCFRPLISGGFESDELSHDGQLPRKKRKLDSFGRGKHSYDAPAPADVLPAQKIIDAVITKYFATIHHWLPMVHERRLRARLEDEEDSKNLSVLIHAMILATLRHINPTEVDIDSEGIETQVRLSTTVVMLNAFDSKYTIQGLFSPIYTNVAL